MKLCKDCKWCDPGKILFVIPVYTSARCKHPKAAKKPDYVTGGEPGHYYCSTERAFSDSCGAWAFNFEPKE